LTNEKLVAVQWDRAIYRQLAWLALCALIFGAVAPSISQWLATSQGGAWIDICSTNGGQLDAWNVDVKKSPEAPIATDVHCGYCLLQHQSPFVPTPLYSLNVVVASADRLLVGRGGTTVFKRFVRSAHPARAPPAVS
jgi:hypothetical protein